MQTLKYGCAALGLLFLVGCASSPPQASFTQALAPDCRTHANDKAKVMVAPAAGVEMLGSETNRLRKTIQARLDERKRLNQATGDRKEYEVDVTITRYEKGDLFARAMLAGLGQLHIDGTIKVLALPAREQVGEFTVNKTFAWGGIYGASIQIEDVELGFAEGVAAALTGQGSYSSSRPAKPPR